MEAAHRESLTQFISGLPPEDFDNLSEIGKARVFIWFGQEVFQTPLTGDEIEACYLQVGLNIPENSIESRIRKDRSILKLPGNKYGIEKERKQEFDDRYGKFTGLPNLDALKIKPPNLIQDEIAAAYRMAKPYVLLFLIEKSARKWIMKAMTNKLGENWWQIFDNNLIKNKAQSIKEQASKNRLITPAPHDFDYCEFGDLVELLFYIKARWKNTIDPKHILMMINCLKDAVDYRNSIAHNHVLSADNVTEIEQLYKNWCKLISG